MQEMNTNLRRGVRGARRLLAVAPFAAVRTGNEVHLAILVTKAVTSFVEVRGERGIRHCYSLLLTSRTPSSSAGWHLSQDPQGGPAVVSRRLMLRRGALCSCEVAVQQHSHCYITTIF